jgi:hypothetical protein
MTALRLAEANRVRTQHKRAAVDDTVQHLLRTRGRVSVSSVAKQAGVSRNFIYSQEDLHQKVQDAAAGQPHRLHRPRPSPSTEASLRARLVTTMDALAGAKKEIALLEERSNDSRANSHVRLRRRCPEHHMGG